MAGLLSATLSQCWDDLSGFLMAFLLCFFTFVTMFFMMLNMYLFGFHNFVVAVETCFSMMLGGWFSALLMAVIFNVDKATQFYSKYESTL